MVFEKILQKLLENPQPVFDEAVRLLHKIAVNILNNPSDLKLRTLQKSNNIVYNKILSVKGAAECLKLMGFQEDSSSFTLHIGTPLNKLHELEYEIKKWNYTPGVVLKTNISSNPFLKRVEAHFNSVLQYEKKDLQERAIKLVPLRTLEQNAQIRLRSIQEHIKKNKLEDPELSIQDVLILELLKWFKEEFFYWIDNPECSNCKGETKFSHMSTDSGLLLYTERIEVHKCISCHQFTSFPRYNDLNILLETRRGRCGEWANTFTLFCRAMGWDSRFVVDEGDHVWTEVYSMTQKRWLHCDPCENICDSPLVYENGWHKEISYVIAYSADEVQDVTWRYSSNHLEVLRRRNNCSEKELLDTIFNLRVIRQTAFSEAKRKYLTRRLLDELVEFLTEKKPAEDEQKGRTSGSSIWRLARGEIHEVVDEEFFIWQINSDEIIDNQVTIRYSTSLDQYEYISGGKNLLKIKNWNKGVFKHSGIFRKEETDWKMVYLARIGKESGQISWKINFTDSNKLIESVILHFNHVTFENGAVKVEICSDSKTVLLRNDQTMIKVDDFHMSSSLNIKAILSGGKGNQAWQHSQLFRQPSDSSDFPFSLTIIFK